MGVEQQIVDPETENSGMVWIVFECGSCGREAKVPANDINKYTDHYEAKCDVLPVESWVMAFQCEWRTHAMGEVKANTMGLTRVFLRCPKCKGPHEVGQVRMRFSKVLL